MAAVSSEVVVDGIVFPPVARPPGSSRSLFLAGAGVRGLEIDGVFVKFTASGVYLEDAAARALAGRWGGKTGDELASDPAFFRDIYAGEFDKFTRITFIRPLAGDEFAAKVAENCVAIMKAAGAYTDAEAEAVEEFRAAFRPQSFQPGASALFVDSPAAGVLTVAFSKDSSVPEAAGSGGGAIRSKVLAQAFLASIIGEGGVSPAARRSIATRMPELLKGTARTKLGPADDAPAQAERSPVMSA